MRWDQVRTPVSRSLSQSAVAVSSSAAASRVRLIATVSRASSRSVTSIVAPVTLATGPCSSSCTSVQACRCRTRPSGCTTRKTSHRPVLKPTVRSATACARSSGCTAARKASWSGGVSEGSRPTRRNISSDQWCAPVTRSSSHQASPVSSWAARQRTARTLRSASAYAVASRLLATSASMPSSSRSSSSKVSTRDDTAAISAMPAPSCTSGTMIEDRVPVLALIRESVRPSTSASRQSWPSSVARARPPRVPGRGMRWPGGAPVVPAVARATMKSPSGSEAMAPSAGKTVRTDSASTWKMVAGTGAAVAMSRCASTTRRIRARARSREPAGSS